MESVLLRKLKVLEVREVSAVGRSHARALQPQIAQHQSTVAVRLSADGF